MGWFQKKRDPIAERERLLQAEIKALESQIQRLHHQSPTPSLKLRSTFHPGSTPAPTAAPPPPDPVFEEVDQKRLKTSQEAQSPQHYNELGMRKYDLPAAWKRFKEMFRGPTASNPRLVNYLAAGSVQGLRPLRYEKRVARNRFLVLVVVLFILLLGLLRMIFSH